MPSPCAADSASACRVLQGRAAACARCDSPQFQALFGPRSTKSVDFRQLPGLAESRLEYENDLLPNKESIFLY